MCLAQTILRVRICDLTYLRSQNQAQVVFLSSEGDGEVWTARAAKALHRATARTPTPCLTDSHQGRWAPKRGLPASESRNNPPNHATRQPTTTIATNPKNNPPRPLYVSQSLRQIWFSKVPKKPWIELLIHPRLLGEYWVLHRAHYLLVCGPVGMLEYWPRISWKEQILSLSLHLHAGSVCYK